MKCPTCRRSYEQPPAECSRCGTDLTLLLRSAAEHDRLVHRGKAAIRERNSKHARDCFRQALRIRAESPEARKGLAVTALVEKQFATALRHYQSIR